MILPYRGKMPRIAPSAYIAPTATVIGDVTIGDEASVWFGAVLRGDAGRIEIGPRANVQDNAVIHSTEHTVTVVREGVTIGHGAVLEGCTVERGALVGINAVLLHRVVVGEEAVIGAGSVATDDTRIPPRTMAAGAPCTVRKHLSGSSAEWVAAAAAWYVKLSRWYLEERPGEIRAAEPTDGPASG
jgi:carbonic anhydrase/acetyltransferase-like protein (isoleucine patch superfamily)